MGWIKNAKKEKPETAIEETKFSKSGLIHLKIGLTFIGCYDYEQECWWCEGIRISDSDVMFWCNIPKLPKKK